MPAPFTPRIEASCIRYELLLRTCCVPGPEMQAKCDEPRMHSSDGWHGGDRVRYSSSYQYSNKRRSYPFSGPAYLLCFSFRGTFLFLIHRLSHSEILLANSCRASGCLPHQPSDGGSEAHPLAVSRCGYQSQCLGTIHACYLTFCDSHLPASESEYLSVRTCCVGIASSDLSISTTHLLPAPMPIPPDPSNQSLITVPLLPTHNFLVQTQNKRCATTPRHARGSEDLSFSRCATVPRRMDASLHHGPVQTASKVYPANFA